MVRGRVEYSVGNEHNPTDPFGRSELAIATDGTARLDHYAAGGAHRAWSGRVAADALDRMWAGLERARFPEAPDEDLPAGASLRTLRVGNASAVLEWHATAKLAGYSDAFDVLDAIVRQLSGDTVQATPPRPAIVRDIAAVD